MPQYERGKVKIMLKSSLNNKKTLVLLAVISVISGIGLCFVAEFCLPIVAAILAVLYLYDSSSGRILSVVISIFILLANAITVLFVGGYTVILALESVLLAVVIAACYSKGATKTGTVFYTTVIAAAFVVLAFISIPIIAERTFSFEVVENFYSHLYDTLERSFVITLSDVYANMDMGGAEINIGTEELESVFERATYMLISIVIICALAIVGIAFKIFSALVAKLDSEPTKIAEWKFEMPVLYAYFFMALSLINIFTASSMSVFAISVSNLYNVFLCVYAYVGIKMIYNRFSEKHNKLVVRLIIFAIILLVFSFAVQIFALIGVFYSIYQNKLQKLGGN